jgi:hypothetical protein
VEAGLLERTRVLHGEPGVYVATLQGLGSSGLDGLRVCRVRPGGFAHLLACADVAVGLECEHARALWWSDRQLRLVVSADDGFVSVPVDWYPNGHPRLHRPDLAVQLEHGYLAIEVELTLKTPARVADILEGYAGHPKVTAVEYFCPPLVARAIGRAACRAGIRGWVRRRPLPTLEPGRRSGMAELLEEPRSIRLDEKLLTARDVAQLLQLPTSTMYELARTDPLPCLRIARAIRFYQGDLETHLGRASRSGIIRAV